MTQTASLTADLDTVMTTDTCETCGQTFQFTDATQQPVVFNDALGMWLLICDPCAVA